MPTPLATNSSYDYTTKTNQSQRSSLLENASAIAGVVIGGISALFLLCGLMFCCFSHKEKLTTKEENPEIAFISPEKTIEFISDDMIYNGDKLTLINIPVFYQPSQSKKSNRLFRDISNESFNISPTNSSKSSASNDSQSIHFYEFDLPNKLVHLQAVTRKFNNYADSHTVVQNNEVKSNIKPARVLSNKAINVLTSSGKEIYSKSSKRELLGKNNSSKSLKSSNSISKLFPMLSLGFFDSSNSLIDDSVNNCGVDSSASIVNENNAHEYLDYHIIKAEFFEGVYAPRITTQFIPSLQSNQTNHIKLDEPVITTDRNNVNVKSSFIPEMNYNASNESPIIDFIGNPTDASNFFNSDLDDIQIDFSDNHRNSVLPSVNSNIDLNKCQVTLI